MHIQPDYTRFLKTIRHQEPDRVPLMDFGVDTPIKDQFMGRPIRAVEDQVAFQAAAGFDFIYLRANYDFPGAPPPVSTGTPRAWEAEPESETISTLHMGVVKDARDLERLAWPDPLTVDATTLDRAAARAAVQYGDYYRCRRDFHQNLDAIRVRAIFYVAGRQF